MKLAFVYSLLLKSCLIFVVSVRVSCSLDIVEIISKLNDQGNTTELAEKVYRRLDNIEDFILKSWRRTKYQRKIIKTFMVKIVHKCST